MPPISYSRHRSPPEVLRHASAHQRGVQAAGVHRFVLLMLRSRLITSLFSAALSLAQCPSAVAQAIVLGAKEFTEQLLVAEMTTQLLKARGFTVHRGNGLTVSGVRDLQERGIIDLYWEYTGTALAVFNGVREKLSPDEAYARVKALDAQRGLVWLTPSKVNNTYALAMRRTDAEAKGVASISDLATRIRAGEVLRLACPLEFPTRADGLKPLQQTYRFEFGAGSVLAMDSGSIYRAFGRSGGIDVAVVFATDGRIAESDLTILRDDRGFFRSYLLTPVVRQATLERYPEIKPILERLSTELDNDTIAGLNASVDLHGRIVEEVASEFLRDRALLSAP